MLHLFGKKICQAGSGVFIKIGLICLLLCGGQTFHVYGQIGKPELYMQDQDVKPYYFGMNISILSARFLTELHPRFLMYDSVYVAEPINSGGFGAGIQMTMRLSDRFQLRFNPQLQFVDRNIKYNLKYPDLNGDTSVTKTINSVTASFPINLKFHSDRIGKSRVYTLIGIKADIDMASNARAKKAEDLVKIEKYDWGPEFGIGFNFYFPSFILSPEIKISNGLNNLHARDENLKFSNVFDKIQSRMIVFTIHIEG